MRLLSFTRNGAMSFGAWTDRGIVDLGAREGFRQLGDLATLIATHEPDAVAAAVDRASPDFAPEDVTLQVPIPSPGRIICVGINYRARPGEYGEREAPSYPSLFLRSPLSLAAHGAHLLRPPESLQLDYEGEIALIIGRGGRRIAEAHAMKHIAGYSCFNEGTMRDWVRHGVYNVTAGKNWFRSGAFGPWLATVDEISDPAAMTIETRVNGRRVQYDTTANMIFPMPQLIAYISTFTPLEPGDVIATGTPTGAGGKSVPPRYLVPGDVVEIEVSGVGVLRNVVADEVADSPLTTER